MKKFNSLMMTVVEETRQMIMIKALGGKFTVTKEMVEEAVEDMANGKVLRSHKDDDSLITEIVDTKDLEDDENE